MSKVLIFTTIEKLGYYLDIKNKKDELKKSFKKLIEEEYGLSAKKMNHSSVYGSEAMNGDILYIEIVSEEETVVKEIAKKMYEDKLRTSGDLNKWIEQQNFTLMKQMRILISMMNILLKFKK